MVGSNSNLTENKQERCRNLCKKDIEELLVVEEKEQLCRNLCKKDIQDLRVLKENRNNVSNRKVTHVNVLSDPGTSNEHKKTPNITEESLTEAHINRKSGTKLSCSENENNKSESNKCHEGKLCPTIGLVLNRRNIRNSLKSNTDSSSHSQISENFDDTPSKIKVTSSQNQDFYIELANSSEDGYEKYNCQEDAPCPTIDSYLKLGSAKQVLEEPTEKSVTKTSANASSENPLLENNTKFLNKNSQVIKGENSMELNKKQSKTSIHSEPVVSTKIVEHSNAANPSQNLETPIRRSHESSQKTQAITNSPHQSNLSQSSTQEFTLTDVNSDQKPLHGQPETHILKKPSDGTDVNKKSSKRVALLSSTEIYSIDLRKKPSERVEKANETHLSQKPPQRSAPYIVKVAVDSMNEEKKTSPKSVEPTDETVLNQKTESPDESKISPASSTDSVKSENEVAAAVLTKSSEINKVSSLRSTKPTTLFTMSQELKTAEIEPSKESKISSPHQVNTTTKSDISRESQATASTINKVSPQRSTKSTNETDSRQEAQAAIRTPSSMSNISPQKSTKQKPSHVSEMSSQKSSKSTTKSATGQEAIIKPSNVSKTSSQRTAETESNLNKEPPATKSQEHQADKNVVDNIRKIVDPESQKSSKPFNEEISQKDLSKNINSSPYNEHEKENKYHKWKRDCRQGIFSLKSLLDVCEKNPDSILRVCKANLNQDKKVPKESSFEKHDQTMEYYRLEQTHGTKHGLAKYHFLMVDASTSVTNLGIHAVVSNIFPIARCDTTAVIHTYRDVEIIEKIPYKVGSSEATVCRIKREETIDEEPVPDETVMEETIYIVEASQTFTPLQEETKVEEKIPEEGTAYISEEDKRFLFPPLLSPLPADRPSLTSYTTGSILSRDRGILPDAFNKERGTIIFKEEVAISHVDAASTDIEVDDESKKRGGKRQSTVSWREMPKASSNHSGSDSLSTGSLQQVVKDATAKAENFRQNLDTKRQNSLLDIVKKRGSTADGPEALEAMKQPVYDSSDNNNDNDKKPKKRSLRGWLDKVKTKKKRKESEQENDDDFDDSDSLEELEDRRQGSSSQTYIDSYRRRNTSFMDNPVFEKKKQLNQFLDNI